MKVALLPFAGLAPARAPEITEGSSRTAVPVAFESERVSLTLRRFVVSVAAIALVASRLLAADVCPAPDRSCGTPVEAPVQLSALSIPASSSSRYFVYGPLSPTPIPLIGMSYEYVCYACMAQQDGINLSSYAAQYCSASNYVGTVYPELKNSHNNVIRIIAIMTGSNGKYLQGYPWLREQPFKWNAVSGKWDPSLGIDSDWVNSIEGVLCSAYKQKLIVEVTLFDTWQGNVGANNAWSRSAFNPVNTIGSKGFTSYQYFGAFEGPDDDVVQQNKDARKTQYDAVALVVQRLKKFPNLIWQVANEPDFTPPGVTVAQIVKWQNKMADKIWELDQTHVIIANGHTSDSFGWKISHATGESAHYTQISDAREGAIELMRDASLDGEKAKVAMGFDENLSVPGGSRKPADMRAEAWEFAGHAGGLFNGYSVDRTVVDSQTVRQSLGVLYDTLTATSIGGIAVSFDLTHMNKTACATNAAATSPWCAGVPGWGTIDNSCGSGTPIFWSAMTDAVHGSMLYLHHGVQLAQAFSGYSESTCGNGVSTGFRTGVAINLSTGCWNVQWKDPQSGVVRSSTWLTSPFTGNHFLVTSPLYVGDIALVVHRQESGVCGL